MSNANVQKNTDLALETAADRCIENGEFTDAFLLLRLVVGRGSDRSDIIIKMIDCAAKGRMKAECLDSLIAFAKERSDTYSINSLLAGMLASEGRVRESKIYANIAAKARPLFHAQRSAGKIKVLVLQSIATGGYRFSYRKKHCAISGVNGLHHLFDSRKVACHRLLVDDRDTALRIADTFTQYDLIYNSMADPSRCEAGLENAILFCDRVNKPVLNHPRQLLALKRELFYEKFATRDDIVVPPTFFLSRQAAKGSKIRDFLNTQPALSPPAIVRAAGFQAGQFMTLVEDFNEPFTMYTEDGVHIIQYVDVSFTDERAPGVTFYPKYRAILANGKLFPIHLFVAEHYNVHKRNSESSIKYPWLDTMEIDYQTDPENHFQKGRWKALESALATLDLDYVGVDFAASSRPEDEGKLVVFECNPSMRNRLTQLPDGDRVQQQWKKAVTAVHEALCAKAGLEPWDFQLKPGLPSESPVDNG